MFQGFKPKASKSRKVVFEFYAPQVSAVQLAGDFNGWDPSRSPLRHEGKGKWKVVLELPAGRYEYRFWVDGAWQNDQRPVECVPNPFGTWNCVLEVQ